MGMARIGKTNGASVDKHEEKPKHAHRAGKKAKCHHQVFLLETASPFL